MKQRKLITFIAGVVVASNVAASVSSPKAPSASQSYLLEKQTGFFRFSFDDVKMPQNIDNVGLVGLNYFLDITPYIYGGVGTYGSVTGTQGGLFVLGFGGGIHREIFPHWWGDVGMFVGGGGGRASYVGGGLMLRPSIGVEYSWDWARLGAHYSYITFPSGQIRSHQVGLDLDIPCDFYYMSSTNVGSAFNLNNIVLPKDLFLDFQRNDFALLLQAYNQKAGTKNVYGDVQDGTIDLVGAELDHYITDHGFWYIKAAGAFSGVPNGYMDILGGFGYHWTLAHGIALVPQFGVGAGGGGNVDTGGGVLVQPQLGIELPLTQSFSTRVSGGYLWSPKGNMRAYTATGELIYHLDIARMSDKLKTNLPENFDVQGWRIQLLNQTYIHPQRASSSITSAINLVVLQIDQLFTPHFFFTYQAASAYDGNHSGGYATGMIGPGLQTGEFFNHHARLFANVLIGAGGGGGLAIGGGALVEPVVGLHYSFTPALGMQASVGQLKAISNDMNTPVVNVGFTLRFGTLERG